MCNVPIVQVWVPSPFPHTLKAGEGRPGVLWPAGRAICTVTSLAVPPSGETLIVYSAVSPGCTEGVAASTLTQISVGVDDGADAFVPDDGDDPVPEEFPPPGVIGGVGDEVGAEGSTWH